MIYRVSANASRAPRSGGYLRGAEKRPHWRAPRRSLLRLHPAPNHYARAKAARLQCVAAKRGLAGCSPGTRPCRLQTPPQVGPLSMERAQGGGLGSRPGGSTARRTRPAPWWLRLELSTTTACAQRERPAARPHRRRRQQRALRQRLVMVDMLQLAARGVDELCARLVKGERERCKLQDATTKTLLRTRVRARARARTPPHAAL